jgi:hypothetical protein
MVAPNNPTTLSTFKIVVPYQGLAGTVTWRSFHAAANWTCSEGDRPLRRVRYKERPEGLFSVSGGERKCVSSAPADGVAVPLACGDETPAPATLPDTEGPSVSTKNRPVELFPKTSAREVVWPSCYCANLNAAEAVKFIAG